LFRRYLRKFYDAFLSLKGPPKKIARSFAAGVFVGCSPFIGTHTVTCVLAAPVFRLNFTAMYLPTWLVCNPLTVLPMMVMEYEVGRRLLQWPLVHWPKEGFTLRAIPGLGWDVIAPLSVGWLVAGVILALASYPAVLHSARRIKGKARDDASPETAPPNERHP